MLYRHLLTGGAFRAWARGTLTAGGSPVTIIDDGKNNVFPGLVRLDDDRVLMVYRRGTNHYDDGEIYGRIGTKTSTWTFSWGSAFLIYTNADDVRCEDPVSIIDGRVVIAGRLYDGSDNHSPFLLICDDLPENLTSTSTWGSPISVPLTSFTDENLISGRVLKLANNTYIVGYYGWNTAATFESGVLISNSLTDWSARTKVAIGTGATNHDEICLDVLPSGTLVAHMRTDGTSPLQIYRATSTDYGVTWSATASAFQGGGYPSFRVLTSGLQLTVYRRAISTFHVYWRQSATDGASWTAETLLDDALVNGAASVMTYASLLQLDATHVLCVYSSELNAETEANIWSQIFTDSSTH